MKLIKYLVVVLLSVLYSCGGSQTYEKAAAEDEAVVEETAPELIPVSVHTLDTVALSVQRCWEIVADFNALDKWLAPAVVSSTMEGEGLGAVRTLTLEDGNQVVEELINLDEENMTIQYKITQGDPNRSGYVGTMKVLAVDDNNTALDWTSDFESPAGADSASYALIKGIHLLMFANLDKEAAGE